MPIVLRLQKGSSLSYQELDNNFVNLDTRVQTLESSIGSSSDSNIPYTEDTANILQWVEGTYDFGNNIIKYANVIQAESELANYSPATYHGMTMHVHETGALYYAHAGAWRKLLTDNADGDAAAAGYVDPLSTVAYEGDLGSLTDVVTQGVSDGDVLKYNATAGWFEPAPDLTADVGSGISLTDLSVNVQPPGSANLAYDNTTGVFSYTPPDVGELSYTPDSANDLQWAEGTYDFGNNIIKYANVIQAESELANYSPATYHGMTMHVHETGALYYAHAGAWRKLITDTSFNDAVAAGYVDPLSTVAYDGDYNSLTNTPSIPSTLTDLGISDGSNGQILSTDGSGNFSFVNGAGGATSLDDLTDVSVSGATSGQVLKYNGSFWEPATDLTSDSGSGIALSDLSVSVQTAGSANLTYNNSTGVFSYTPPDLSSYALLSNVPTELTDLGITDGVNGQVLTTDGAGNFSFTTVLSNGSGDPDQNLWETITADSGSTTASSTTDTLAIVGGTDISTSITGDTVTISFTGSSNGASNFNELTDALTAGLTINQMYLQSVTRLKVTNSGASAYLFDQYPGNNPTLRAVSGTTIAFDLDVSGHPFLIQDEAGTNFDTGLVHVSVNGTVTTGSSAQGQTSGTLYWKIPNNISGSYRYICSIHGSMVGAIEIADSALVGNKGLVSRDILTGSTGSINDGNSANVNITGYKGYMLYKIETSAAAWVRLYVSDSARTADAGRTQGQDPLPGSGVIAEVITAGSETVIVAPGVIGFNNESPITDIIPTAITNLSGGSADITVTLTAVEMEI